MPSTVQQAVGAVTALVASRPKHGYQALGAEHLDENEYVAEQIRFGATRTRRLRWGVVGTVILFGIAFIVYGFAM
jgi:hypothetical protein